MSEDSNVMDDPYLNSSSNKSGTSAIHAFFKAFRSKNTDRYPDAPAGMEQNLISQIERMNFKEQMEMFYTAYSKVCTPSPQPTQSSTNHHNPTHSSSS
jgi:hypothetical protein